MVHNFTLYNLKTADVNCFLWDETMADLSASVFASMLVSFINTNVIFQEGDEIIFYSDGCTYQNRNSVLSDALLDVAIMNKIYIIQKYLERGHTQMECDAAHSSIEQ